MLLKLLLKKRKKLPWPIQFGLSHLATFGKAKKFASSFAAVETYCTFIGYSRSGHSLIAALLDAHPHIVMAHELRAVKYFQYGFGRNAIYYLLWQMTKIRGHSWKRGSGYTYDVPHQYQGSFEQIRVIGNKHGEFTACVLAGTPNLLQKLQDTVEVPVKLIHVVRNPFDNIAAFAIKRAKRRNSEVTEADIQASIDRYFSVCASVMKVKTMADSINADVLDIRHEDFIKEPAVQLNKLCLWLGVEASSSYLENCASVVFESPHQKRHKIQWSENLKEQVDSKMRLFPFFAGYTFDS
ncbi:MAG: sulfotransferase [Cyanobacteria bacterium J06631_2]